MQKKDITERQLEEKQMELGLQMDEIFKTNAGRFLLDVYGQDKAVTCVEGMLAKFDHVNDGDKKGQYKCQKVEEFWLQRGVALGVQRCIDRIHSTINVGKRVQKQRLKEDENLKSKT